MTQSAEVLRILADAEAAVHGSGDDAEERRCHTSSQHFSQLDQGNAPAAAGHGNGMTWQSEVFAQRPSTTPNMSRPITMLRSVPDPWVMKKKRWLEAHHIRSEAVRRYMYTTGPSTSATTKAATLESLSPFALVGGGSATMASPFFSRSASSMRRPKSSSGSGAGQMMVENPGTKLKDELAARGRKIQADRKKKFETIMAEKAALYVEMQEDACVIREAGAKVRAKDRRAKLKIVQANIVADQKRREAMKVKLQLRLVAEERGKEARAEDARLAEIARIKRDEKRRVMRHRVKVDAQAAYEENKIYWAPMTKTGQESGYLLEPHPINVGLVAEPRALSETTGKDPESMLREREDDDSM